MERKTDNTVLLDYEEKRAPVAGFLGMRGKKGPLVSLTWNVSSKIALINR